MLKLTFFTYLINKLSLIRSKNHKTGGNCDEVNTSGDYVKFKKLLNISNNFKPATDYSSY